MGKEDTLLIWMIGPSYFKIRKEICSTDAAVPSTWRGTPTPYEPFVRFGLPIQTRSAPRYNVLLNVTLHTEAKLSV